MKNVKLVKASRVLGYARSVKNAAVSASISMVFHSLKGNVSFTNGVDKQELPSLMLAKFRKFIAVTWNKETNAWEYNKDKCTKTLETLGLDFESFTFDELLTALDEVLTVEKPEKTQEQIKAGLKNRYKKLMVELAENGLTLSDLK